MAYVNLDDSGDPQENAGIVLTRKELEAWAGRKLSGEDVARLAASVRWSSIPDAIAAIVAEFDGMSTHPDPGIEM